MSDVKPALQYNDEVQLMCEHCKQYFLFDYTFKNCVLFRCEECLNPGKHHGQRHQERKKAHRQRHEQAAKERQGSR
jgi:hypothetical protein